MKKGGELETIANDFLEQICTEMGLSVTTVRTQHSGSQDGYDDLIQVIDERGNTYTIYCECKDYTTKLHYSEAMTKLPQLASTHQDIDLALFLSPYRPFSNIMEPTRNKPFFEAIIANLFHVAFLTPDQHIRQYFSLYPDLYKKVYRSDADKLPSEQRAHLIKSFRSFLFSDHLLNKVVIDESDREAYIGKLLRDPVTISRTVRPSQERSQVELYNPSNTSLQNALAVSEKGIVLLGGAGHGKSTELRNFAVDAWESRESDASLPVFVRLKAFNAASTIEGLLPAHALRITGLVIILDGVDEVENITDFTNKLRGYIDKHEKKLEKSKIRFIISCRTNVYRKYIKQVGAFSEYYLNEVAFSSAAYFLFHKFGLDLTKQLSFDYTQQRQLFENPFYLELIGKYFTEHKTLRTDKAALIGEFVNSRLKHDEDDKYINDAGFDRDRVISDTKMAAFTFESLQRTNLSTSELKKCTGIEAKALAKNPFLEENADGTWSFENKNIQEYFVATLLVELPFEEILALIRIDPSINKVHPTWYNVVSFTLNLGLPKEVYESLADWLAENDYEVLFNADANLIGDDIKERLLSSYFERHCEQETLWINDAAQIARFSQTNGNIAYLLQKISDFSVHRRARMSAIKVLSYMEVPLPYHDNIRVLIKNLLAATYSDEDYIHLKEELIMLAKSLGLSDDKDFFGEIIAIVREDDHREIVGSILRAVPPPAVEENIDYFLGILDKSLGLKEWKFAARTRSMTSTKEMLFGHFGRITNPDLLIRIYQFLLARHKDDSLKESLLADFLKHLEVVFKERPEYHPALITIISNAVINDSIRHYEDDLLVSLVKACGIAKPIAGTILAAVKGNSSTKHFLAEIVEQEDFPEIIERYNDGNLNGDFLREFRNVISRRSFSLSKNFEEIAERHSNYRFTDKISSDEANQWSMVHKTNMQDDFNLLFDHSEILKQITFMYTFLGKEIMTNKDLEIIYKRYYHDIELYQAVRTNAKQLLGQMIRQGKGLRLSDVPKRLKSLETDIMFDIYEALPKPDKNTTQVELSGLQVKHIENWCKASALKLRDFYSFRLLADKQLRFTEEFSEYQLIHNFHKHFGFAMDKETLLNFLYFKLWEDNRIKLPGKETPPDITAGGLTHEEIGQRVLWNLEHAELPSSAFYGHICYCLEHNLDIQSLGMNFIDIIYSYLNNGSETTALQLAEKLYRDDDSVLSGLMEYNGQPRVRRMVYDTVINIWSNRQMDSTVREFLLQNYTGLTESQVYDEIDIIRRLVACNAPEAFHRLISYISRRLADKKTVTIEFRHDDWQRYSNVLGIDDLVAIMELYLTTPDSETVFDRFSLPSRVASEALINICKNHNAETCTIVIEKLSAMDFDKIDAAGGDLFYYHRLKNDIMEIYYKHKSKAFSFKEVLQILDENRHLFIR